jgi:hypothetical protein
MKGRRRRWVRQKMRGKEVKAEDMETISGKITNPEKKKFYEICYQAKVSPSKVIRSFVRMVNDAGDIAPALIEEIGKIAEEK